MGLGRLYDARPETVPAARWQCCVDLQLVELVRPPGRPGSSAKGDHQPAVVEAGDRAADPTCRASDADHHQHARRTTQSTPGLSAARRLPDEVAPNWGAVGSGAAVVSHPQRGAETLPQGALTRSAAAPCASLSCSHWLCRTKNPARESKSTAGFRIIHLPFRRNIELCRQSAT